MVLTCFNLLMIFVTGSFSLVSKLLIDGMCVVVTTYNHAQGYSPSSWWYAIKKWLINFFNFSIKGLYKKSNITMSEFYELHFEFWVLVGGGCIGVSLAYYSGIFRCHN